jgi:hypothetical protein
LTRITGKFWNNSKLFLIVRCIPNKGQGLMLHCDKMVGDGGATDEHQTMNLRVIAENNTLRRDAVV